MYEAQNHVNDVEHEKPKNSHREQQEEKRIKKKMRTAYTASRTTSRGPTFTS